MITDDTTQDAALQYDTTTQYHTNSIQYNLGTAPAHHVAAFVRLQVAVMLRDIHKNQKYIYIYIICIYIYIYIYICMYVCGGSTPNTVQCNSARYNTVQCTYSTCTHIYLNTYMHTSKILIHTPTYIYPSMHACLHTLH